MQFVSIPKLNIEPIIVEHNKLEKLIEQQFGDSGSFDFGDSEDFDLDVMSRQTHLKMMMNPLRETSPQLSNILINFN